MKPISPLSFVERVVNGSGVRVKVSVPSSSVLVGGTRHSQDVFRNRSQAGSDGCETIIPDTMEVNHKA